MLQQRCTGLGGNLSVVNLPVVLASASPRRQELLRRLFDDFEVVVAGIEEDALTLPDPWQTAMGLARAKARAVAEHRQDALVIGGDTVVALPKEDGAFEQLAKPGSTDEAIGMLQALSGRSHLVITGVCLLWPGGEEVFCDESRVTFRPLELEEIKEYVATGEPMDKAGAYGIQAGGGTFVHSVEGSVANVIGLPVEALERRLRTLSVKR